MCVFDYYDRLMSCPPEDNEEKQNEEFKMPDNDLEPQDDDCEYYKNIMQNK